MAVCAREQAISPWAAKAFCDQKTLAQIYRATQSELIGHSAVALDGRQTTYGQPSLCKNSFPFVGSLTFPALFWRRTIGGAEQPGWILSGIPRRWLEGDLWPNGICAANMY